MGRFRIDWLSFTIFGVDSHAAFWAEFFEDKLGNLTSLGHGGRGFHEILQTANGAKVYVNPVSISDKGVYFHIELPGQSMACLTPQHVIDMFYLMKAGIPIQVTRLDLAWDDVFFTPDDFYTQLIEGKVVTRATRQSITYYESPFQEQEIGGKIGCHTCYVGARSSERMIRVYDLHGFTRLEFQLRGDWAHVVAGLLMQGEYQSWVEKSLTFLKQYIDFPGWDLWKLFLHDSEMATIVVKSARLVSMSRLEKWLAKQVIPGLFVMQAIYGIDDFWEFVVRNITDKRLEKYKPIIEAYYGGKKITVEKLEIEDNVN